jgi:hypothetical protein
VGEIAGQRRHRRPRARRGLGLLAFAGLLFTATTQPLPVFAAPSLSVAPTSGLVGSNATLTGSGWAFNTPPYELFWDVEGGTPLGSFLPSPNGTWTKDITIPKSGAGKHPIVACQAYGLKNQACEKALFDVTQLPTSTPTPVPTNTPQPTSTKTFTPVPTTTTPPTPFNPNGPTFTSTPTPTATPTRPPTTTPTASLTPTALPDIVLGSGGACAGPPAAAEVVTFDRTVERRPVLESDEVYRVAEVTGNVVGTSSGRGGTNGATLQRPSDASGATYAQARAIQLVDSRSEPLAPASWSTVGVFVSMPAGGEPFRLAAYDGLGREVATGVVGGGDTSLDWACVSVSAPGIVAVRMAPVSSYSVTVNLDDFFFVREETPVAYRDELVITSPPDPSTTSRTIAIEGMLFSNRPSGRVGLAVVPEGSARGGWFGLSHAVGSGPWTASGYGHGDMRVERDPASIFRYRFAYTLARPPAGEHTYDAFLSDGLLLEADVVRFAEDHVTINFIPPTPTVTPTARPTPRPTPFSLSVHAIEVTQGVRGDLPSRTPDGDLVLPTDDWIHVANRKTVVRVYPWLEFADRLSVPVAARLYGSRGGVALPGSPIAPVAPVSLIDRTWFLGDLRSNAARSWNFVLPSSWTTAGAIDLRVELNPAGSSHVDECGAGVRVPSGSRCFGADDNTADLRGVRFQDTNGIVFRVLLSQNHRADTEGDAASTGLTPSFADLASTLDWLWKTYPISDLGISMPSIRGVAADCLGVSGDCDELATAHAVARADVARLGIASGSRTLFPIVVNRDTGRGCAGRAGLPNPVYWQGACGNTLAQETLHAGAAINHAGNGHGEATNGGFNPAYPDMHGAIERNAYGFDLLALQAISPTTTCDTGHRHDFMSYGCSPWVSMYTWEAIAAWLASAPERAASPQPRPLFVSQVTAPAAPATEALMLDGNVAPSGDVALAAPLLVDAPPDEAGGSGSFTAQLLDSTERVLYSRAFDASAVLHAPPGTGEFTLLLPRVAGVARVRLLRDRSTVAEVAGLGAIDAPIFAPASVPGELGASGDARIAWESSQAGLTFTLEAGPDADGSWVTLGRTRSNDMTVDLSSLPEDCTCRFRLQASDGVNIVATESKEFHTSARAPQPVILSPASRYVRPMPLTLTGMALGGAASEGAFEWLIDGDVVAFGATADVDPLAEGTHHVVLRLTQNGSSSEAAQDVEVAADTDGDGLPDDWERKYGLDPTDPEDATSDRDGDHLAAWQELAYGTRPDRRDTDGDRYADDVEVAGGGDPLDAKSLPRAFHGVEGQPLPQLAASGGSVWRQWWLYAAVAAALMAVVGSVGMLNRRRVKRTATPSPSDDTDDPIE